VSIAYSQDFDNATTLGGSEATHAFLRKAPWKKGAGFDKFEIQPDLREDTPTQIEEIFASE